MVARSASATASAGGQKGSTAAPAAAAIPAVSAGSTRAPTAVADGFGLAVGFWDGVGALGDGVVGVADDRRQRAVHVEQDPG